MFFTGCCADVVEKLNYKTPKNMLKHFFKIKKNIVSKYGYVILPFWLKIYPIFKIMTNKKTRKQNEDAINFYTNNFERVKNVVAMLADEESKNVLLQLIKYRQRFQKEDFPNSNVENQYFINEVKFSNNEIFIDCGAYNGDTIDKFIKHCPNYACIVAFEPDKRNYYDLKKKYGHDKKVILHNAGCYDYDGEVQFKMIGNAMSKILFEHDGITGANICVKSIDNLLLNKVTFIKMDIEGAELNALKGAQKTILRDKPKLAVSIYHSHEEMLSIAEFIHALMPEYKLLIRHHGNYPNFGETVLYAVMSLPFR